MTSVLYLAWKYLAYHRFKTAVLVSSITLIIYLPVGLNILVSHSARQLRARANATPLLIGAKGSPLELVLSSLYFDSAVPSDMLYGELQTIADSGLAQPIPLHTRFRTGHGPIVGTSLEYFDFRGLSFEQGRPFGMLGECVVGAKVAHAAGVQPGDSMMSLPESVFDIAGVYPLKMKVVGVLAISGTPDDNAVLVDVRTAWVIAGLAHGHQDLNRPEAEASVLRKEGNTVIANASVVQFNEITADNVNSFHFHGDTETFPITSIIAVPPDDKSATLLQGRYLSDANVQIVQPTQIMDKLITTVLTVRRYILVAVAVIAIATFATMVLVFLLSLQLRRREMETMAKIGGSRLRMLALVNTEIVTVILFGAALAMLLSLATITLADSATQLLVRLT